jgi:DnaJ-class molecular chaperone
MQSEDQSSTAAAVSRILASGSHYSILGVPKTCSQARIRQAYRQLALTCHPDKNKCEGAVQAFQAIGSAYQVLADRGSRQQYDRGVEEDSRDGRRGCAKYNDSQEKEFCNDDEDTWKERYGRKQFFYARRNGG